MSGTDLLLERIRGTLAQSLDADQVDIVDLVQVPARGDRMVRIRTLEEALDDFDRADSGETASYLVQVRARRPSSAPATAAATPAIDESLPFDRLVEETFDHAAGASDLRASGATAAGPARPAPPDSVYLPNGKTNVPFLMRNAELLSQAGEYALARNIYRAVLATGERSAQAHYQIARCFEAESRAAEAQTHYEESITYQPTIEAYQRYAALLIRQKQDQRAAELMERALNLKDLAPALRFELHKACGNCWLRCERPAEAEKQYRAALALDSRSDAILTNLGSLSLQKGDLAQARACFQDAVARNPRNHQALAGLGSCHLSTGAGDEADKRQAHDFFARSLEIELKNPTAVFHLVKLAYELKSYAVAARIVADYMQVGPVNTHLMYSLAGLNFHLGRMAEAGATARKILELQPEHGGAKELLKLIERF